MDTKVFGVVGGIGGLIFLYLVLKNAGAFSSITSSIAQSSTSLISTLQGNGAGFSGVGTSIGG